MRSAHYRIASSHVHQVFGQDSVLARDSQDKQSAKFRVLLDRLFKGRHRNLDQGQVGNCRKGDMVGCLGSSQPDNIALDRRVDHLPVSVRKVSVEAAPSRINDEDPAVGIPLTVYY
jgi:hypothetical protein